MYRIIVLIGLVFTYLWSIAAGYFGLEKPAQVKAVSVNGSLAAVDALGRNTVRATKRWAYSTSCGTANTIWTAPTT